MTALGAALYHDVSLSDVTAPIEALFDTLLAGETSVQQFAVPIAPRKENPSLFRRDSLLERVRRKELASVLVSTPVGTPDADAIMIGVGLVATTAAAQEGRAGYRHRIDVAMGERAVSRHGQSAIVNALLATANAVDPRAGVVLAAASASYAHALATGTRGGLTEEQDQRVKDVFYAVYELGDRIRGPEWGTFLGSHHVTRLGGFDGVERVAGEAGCAIVRRLEGGGAYLQVTEGIQDPDTDERTAALATRLAAVR